MVSFLFKNHQIPILMLRNQYFKKKTFDKTSLRIKWFSIVYFIIAFLALEISYTMISDGKTEMCF